MATNNISKKYISEVSKTEDKKELSLRFPKDLFSVMKDFKKASGVSYPNQIYTAVVWYYFQKGLLDLGWIKDKHGKNGNGKKKEEINMDVVEANQANSFCDGDSCEIIPRSPFNQNC